MIIQGASLLGFDRSRQYFEGDIFAKGDILNLSIEGHIIDLQELSPPNHGIYTDNPDPNTNLFWGIPGTVGSESDLSPWIAVQTQLLMEDSLSTTNLNNALGLLVGNTDDIIVDGFNYGKGRILRIESVSGPETSVSKIHAGRFRVDVEILEYLGTNNFSIQGSGTVDNYHVANQTIYPKTYTVEEIQNNIPVDVEHHEVQNYYQNVESILEPYSARLENFNENFSFDYGVDGGGGYVHSLSFKYRELPGNNGYVISKSIAQNVFSTRPNFGFLPWLKYNTWQVCDNPIHDNQQDCELAGNNWITKQEGLIDYGHGDFHDAYYTETYDLISRQCSFTKTYRVDAEQNHNKGYSSKFSYSLSRGKDGTTSVTEKADIKSMTRDRNLARKGIHIETGNAYERCIRMYNLVTRGQAPDAFNYPAGVCIPNGVAGANWGAINAVLAGGISIANPMPIDEGAYNAGIKSNCLYNQPTSTSIYDAEIDNRFGYELTFSNDPRIHRYNVWRHPGDGDAEGAVNSNLTVGGLEDEPEFNAYFENRNFNLDRDAHGVIKIDSTHKSVPFGAANSKLSKEEKEAQFRRLMDSNRIPFAMNTIYSPLTTINNRVAAVGAGAEDVDNCAACNYDENCSSRASTFNPSASYSEGDIVSWSNRTAPTQTNCWTCNFNTTILGYICSEQNTMSAIIQECIDAGFEATNGAEGVYGEEACPTECGPGASAGVSMACYRYIAEGEPAQPGVSPIENTDDWAECICSPPTEPSITTNQGETALQIVSQSIDHQSFGGALIVERSETDDPNLFLGTIGSYFAEKNVKVNHTLPIRMRETYLIAGDGEKIHISPQSELGVVDIQFRGKLKRNTDKNALDNGVIWGVDGTAAALTSQNNPDFSEFNKPGESYGYFQAWTNTDNPNFVPAHGIHPLESDLNKILDEAASDTYEHFLSHVENPNQVFIMDTKYDFTSARDLTFNVILNYTKSAETDSLGQFEEEAPGGISEQEECPCYGNILVPSSQFDQTFDEMPKWQDLGYQSEDDCRASMFEIGNSACGEIEAGTIGGSSAGSSNWIENCPCIGTVFLDEEHPLVINGEMPMGSSVDAWMAATDSEGVSYISQNSCFDDNETCTQPERYQDICICEAEGDDGNPVWQSMGFVDSEDCLLYVNSDTEGPLYAACQGGDS